MTRAAPASPYCYGCWRPIPLGQGDLANTIIVCPTCFQISICIAPPVVEPFAVRAALAAAMGEPLPPGSVAAAFELRTAYIHRAAQRWREHCSAQPRPRKIAAE